MKKVSTLVLLIVLLASLASTVCAEESGMIYAQWIGSRTSITVSDRHYDWAGPAMTASVHYNVRVYSHRYAWIGRPKTEIANYHVTFYGRPGHRCLYIYESHTGWQLDRCVDTGSWRRTLDAVAYGMRDAIYVTVGVAIPLWMAYVLAGIIAPLAFI